MYSKLPQIDYVNLSPKDLAAVQDHAHQAEQAVRTKALQAARKECEALVKSKGFTLAELGYSGKRGGSRAQHKSPSAPKYENPADQSETWTGRGRKPNWLVAKIKDGAHIESFEIGTKQPTATVSKPAPKQRGGKGGTRPKKLFINPKNPKETYKGYGPSPDWYESGMPNVYGNILAA